MPDPRAHLRQDRRPVTVDELAAAAVAAGTAFPATAPAVASHCAHRSRPGHRVPEWLRLPSPASRRGGGWRPFAWIALVLGTGTLVSSLGAPAVVAEIAMLATAALAVVITRRAR